MRCGSPLPATCCKRGPTVLLENGAPEGIRTPDLCLRRVRVLSNINDLCASLTTLTSPIDNSVKYQISTLRCAGLSRYARQQRNTHMATKSPNPTDKHVGGRVRMRRMMLSMSQEKLGDALGLTFQQVQKYEKGTNRIGASRLQHIADILQVDVSFFFEGAPHVAGFAAQRNDAPSPEYVSDFLATADGLTIAKAFMRIGDAKLRRCIADLVERIASDIEPATGARRRPGRNTRDRSQK
jgi:transcriptional regulator with XRE-family HTH domain